jgi:hypothetical protein
MDDDEKYIFYQTPASVAKDLIDLVEIHPDDILFEPFRGEGNFYNQFPSANVSVWSEIREGRNFLDHLQSCDWVITNPPFRINGKNSCFDIAMTLLPWVRKGLCFLLNDNCFKSFLTPRRIEKMRELGFYISKITICNIKKWRGRYFFIQITKQPNQMFNVLLENYE